MAIQLNQLLHCLQAELEGQVVELSSKLDRAKEQQSTQESTIVRDSIFPTAFLVFCQQAYES